MVLPPSVEEYSTRERVCLVRNYRGVSTLAAPFSEQFLERLGQKPNPNQCEYETFISPLSHHPVGPTSLPGLSE